MLIMNLHLTLIDFVVDFNSVSFLCQTKNPQTKETTKKDCCNISRDKPILKGLSPEILETFNQQ